MRATFSCEMSSLSYLRRRRFWESLENGDGHWLCGESESSLLCESSWDCCCCDWPPTIDGFIILDASVSMCAIRSSAMPLSSPRPNDGRPASDPAMLSESVQKIYYDWLPLHATWRGKSLTLWSKTVRRTCTVHTAHSMMLKTYYSFKNNSIINCLCCGLMLIVGRMHMQVAINMNKLPKAIDAIVKWNFTGDHNNNSHSSPAENKRCTHHI